MIRKMTITPKFNVREIIDSTIRKDWFIFQAEAMKVGIGLHKYIQSYINTHTKRGGHSGRLAKSINFVRRAGAGLGEIFWGIGDINILNVRAPYWYVVNYGKTITGKQYIPNYGEFVPGWFRGGDNKADASQSGRGKESFQYAKKSAWGGMFPKHAIRPMNYIQATKLKLNRNLRNLLTKLKRGI